MILLIKNFGVHLFNKLPVPFMKQNKKKRNSNRQDIEVTPH
jgi:hypothetical protein